MTNYYFLDRTISSKNRYHVLKTVQCQVFPVYTFLMQTSNKLEKIINHLTRQIIFFHKAPYEKLFLKKIFFWGGGCNFYFIDNY